MSKSRFSPEDAELIEFAHACTGLSKRVATARLLACRQVAREQQAPGIYPSLFLSGIMKRGAATHEQRATIQARLDQLHRPQSQDQPSNKPVETKNEPPTPEPQPVVRNDNGVRITTTRLADGFKKVVISARQ